MVVNMRERTCTFMHKHWFFTALVRTFTHCTHSLILTLSFTCLTLSWNPRPHTLKRLGVISCSFYPYEDTKSAHLLCQALVAEIYFPAACSSGFTQNTLHPCFYLSLGSSLHFPAQFLSCQFPSPSNAEWCGWGARNLEVREDWGSPDGETRCCGQRQREVWGKCKKSRWEMDSMEVVRPGPLNSAWVIDH